MKQTQKNESITCTRKLDTLLSKLINIRVLQLND